MFVQSYTSDVCFALPSEAEPCLSVTSDTWEGKSWGAAEKAFLNSLEEYFPPHFLRGAKLLPRDCEAGARQTPCTCLQSSTGLGAFLLLRKSCQLVLLFLSCSYWGAFCPKAAGACPQPHLWLLAPPSANSCKNKGSVLDSCGNTAQVAATLPGSHTHHTEQITPEQRS